MTKNQPKSAQVVIEGDDNQQMDVDEGQDQWEDEGQNEAAEGEHEPDSDKANAARPKRISQRIKSANQARRAAVKSRQKKVSNCCLLKYQKLIKCTSPPPASRRHSSEHCITRGMLRMQTWDSHTRRIRDTRMEIEQSGTSRGAHSLKNNVGRLSQQQITLHASQPIPESFAIARNVLVCTTYKF